jgi:hypothetical protein
MGHLVRAAASVVVAVQEFLLLGEPMVEPMMEALFDRQPG